MECQMIGLRRGSINLKGYTSEWECLFEQEARQLCSELKGIILAVEHIGSTSIPGMDAKPILDMMIGVKSMNHVGAVLENLAKLGYQRRVNGDLPDRVFLVKGPESLRTHHLSVTYMKSPFWDEHILFRNALRKDAALAAQYLELKRNLAKQFRADRRSYTAGKEQFIRSALDLARSRQD